MATKKKLNKDKVILIKSSIVVWGLFALFGAFALGGLVEHQRNEYTLADDTPYQNLMDKIDRYDNLLEGYEDLSKLYSDQGENLSIIFNTTLWETHPEEIEQALASMKQYREKIINQRGKIDGLRKAVGIPAEDLKNHELQVN